MRLFSSIIKHLKVLKGSVEHCRALKSTPEAFQFCIDALILLDRHPFGSPRNWAPKLGRLTSRASRLKIAKIGGTEVAQDLTLKCLFESKSGLPFDLFRN